jgi:hypothetical protein
MDPRTWVEMLEGRIEEYMKVADRTKSFVTKARVAACDEQLAGCAACACEASRHFRNAWEIRLRIGNHPHRSLEHYVIDMALRHALQGGQHWAAFHSADEAGRDREEVLSEATRRDLEELDGYRHWPSLGPQW